jgi:hypothetical protein
MKRKRVQFEEKPVKKVSMEQFLQGIKEVEPICIPGYVCLF